MIWHSSEINDVLNELQVDPENGLANGVVDLRLEKYGKNRIKSIEKPSFKKHFLNQLNDKFAYILVAVAVISFILSVLYEKNDYFSPFLIIGIIVINALISAYHLYRSEKALNTLRSITNQTATVIRDGIERHISADELVPGDIILIKSGDYIPADARLIEANSFSCNEYILTGSEVPSPKKAEEIVADISPLPQRTNMVFSGCVAVYGNAKAVVAETGLNTEMGHNSAMDQQAGADTLPIEASLVSSGKIANIIIFVVCAIIFVIGVLQNFRAEDFAFTTVTSLLNALALAVCAIPEGLPAISTVAVALGIERIIRDDIIIKKVEALEVIGKTTVICSDKTGIITQNKMNVNCIFDGDTTVSLDDSALTEKQGLILRLAAFCSTLENDATENGIKEAFEKYSGMSFSDLENQFPRVGVIPFDSTRKTMTTINMIDGKPMAIIKGAPEMLAEKLSLANKESLLKINEEMASKALRVICVAIKPLEEIPANPSADTIENDLTFVGLIGIDDPPSDDTIDSIKICDKAGIRTVMITGDNLVTAMSVARRVGILKDGTLAISGNEIEEMSDDELLKNIGKYSVFARVTPEDKLRIISALQNSGEIVTITGDRFKDVQALSAANIGCAMGEGGSDVARGNADIIINNSNFGSIIDAIKESRGLFANIQKSVSYLLSCNIAELLAYLVALIIFKVPPISASALLWINLLTDCAPVIALSMEKAEKEVMLNKPSTMSGRLFTKTMVMDIVLQSLYIAGISLVAFIVGKKSGGISVASTMTFAVLSLSQIFHTFNQRSNKSIIKARLNIGDFISVSSILLIFIIMFLVVTPAGAVFGLTCLRTTNVLICLALSLSVVLFCEVQKLIKRFTK